MKLLVQKNYQNKIMKNQQSILTIKKIGSIILKQNTQKYCPD